MVEIFSKKDGSDRPNQEVKRFLGENRQKLDRIANHLTQGAWSARNAVPVEPMLERQARVGFVPLRNDTAIEARVRISPNERVVLFDAATSRQIAFLGVIRGTRQDRRFVLATKVNGFIAPVDANLTERLRVLDGAELHGSDATEELARTISVILGLPVDSDDPESGD